jgi:hypothetical protein
LGAQEKHVAAATKLIEDSRTLHYWDGNNGLGKAYQQILKTPGVAWDVYLPFGRGTRWEGRQPPTPPFWMHQLGRVVQAPKLDAQVLGEEIKKLSRIN